MWPAWTVPGPATVGRLSNTIVSFNAAHSIRAGTATADTYAISLSPSSGSLNAAATSTSSVWSIMRSTDGRRGAGSDNAALAAARAADLMVLPCQTRHSRPQDRRQYGSTCA